MGLFFLLDAFTLLHLEVLKSKIEEILPVMKFRRILSY